MDLLTWELKKILRRRSTKIVICIALGYALFLTCYNAMFSLAPSLNDGTGAKGNGLAEIKQEYTWANKFKGPLTGDKLAEALEMYDKAHLPENLETFEGGSIGPSSESWDTYVEPLGEIPNFLHSTFSRLPEYSSYYSIPNIPIPLAEDYYKQRYSILSDYLNQQLPDEQDRMIFIEQEQQVKKPFYYDWTGGHELYLSFFGTISLVAALFTCIAIAPLFSGEYQSGCANLLLGSKNGHGKLANTKITAGMLISGGLYLLCAAVYLVGQLIFIGTRGLSCPIQLIKPLSTAALTIGQAELYTLVLGLLCCLCISSVCIVFSARMKSPFLTIILSMIFLFVPVFLKNSDLPSWLSKIIGLFPFANDYGELFRTNLYHIFGLHIWTPWIMLATPVIIILIALPLAKHSYVRHEA